VQHSLRAVTIAKLSENRVCGHGYILDDLYELKEPDNAIALCSTDTTTYVLDPLPNSST
jgi:hypothetical protein